VSTDCSQTSTLHLITSRILLEITQQECTKY